MIVKPIASTLLDDYALRQIVPDYEVRSDQFVADVDALSEFAGRNCYKAWGKKNPKTAQNHGYLGQILDHKHYSVQEHGSVSFYIDGVSRALMAELTRHRHLSFSINSQRYIDYANTAPVVHPAFEGDEIAVADLQEHYKQCIAKYEAKVAELKDKGLKNKQAREAARQYLPECAPVGMVVTGNLRAWREVIAKRFHEAADAEICRLASLLLSHLKVIAPATFQDFSDEPLTYERGDGEKKP
ncbi:FAD-dependent thymidylate synthase [Streptomyces sp. KLMMK]|uniref:FAD-dependent thymidylate synthase n=1 Tax=Streptomyces sp. KLMMK TaxID=3109353 RepID=UPI002FFD624F